MAGGMYGGGGSVWGGGMHGRGRGTCIVGACVAGGGMHGKGRGICVVGACMAGETATAADSTHNTGTHSC